MANKSTPPKKPDLPPPLWQKGEVILIDLNPPKDKYEIAKIRPAVNVQGKAANIKSKTITIVPFSTTSGYVDTDIHISIGKGEGGVAKKCHALCNQIKTLTKSRVLGRIGNLKTSKMNKILQGINYHLT